MNGSKLTHIDQRFIHKLTPEALAALNKELSAQIKATEGPES